MKNTFVLLITFTSLVWAKWYKVQVQLAEGPLPAALCGFDITRIKPGLWAELVTPEEGLTELQDAGISYRVLVNDLESYYASMMADTTHFGAYYTYSEANAILDSLHQTYPDIISERIALPNDDSDTTLKGNKLWAVKISDNVATDEAEPEVFYTGVHHAREPIGCNICVDWARWLCEGYASNPLATHIVKNREIWIVPVVNPDGYLYNEGNSPQGGGMHRKNLRPTSQHNPGVDINRNYPYMWGYDNTGSSPDPSDDSYRGDSAGSEAETQAIMNLCKTREFVTALNFHSHSNLFLYPWGYQYLRCPDSSAFYNWGEISTRLSRYAVISGYELYITNGDSDDWMYGETVGKNRIFSVTPEVGEDFWQEWQIEQHIKETHPMLVATAKAAAVYPELEWLSWSDGGDDAISPGETVNLVVGIRNMSVRDSSGTISLKLEETHPSIELVKAQASLPSMPPQTSSSNSADPMQVKIASTVQDSAIPLTLSVTAANEQVIYDIILPVGKRDTLIAVDFEDDELTGWSFDWAYTDKEAHSGERSITDSPLGNYEDETTTYLYTPRLDLTGRISAELSFWHRFATEKGFDWAELRVKNDSTGYEWVTLKRWSGDLGFWQQEKFNLSPFCGYDNLQVSFTVTSDQAVNADGWYVDDIVLTAFTGSNFGPGLYELADIRPDAGPRESICTGTIDFTGPSGEELDVTVFDAMGRKVAWTSNRAPFTWQAQDFSGQRLPCGVYFVRTLCNGFAKQSKIVLVD